jgi:ankyrin repeat protein
MAALLIAHGANIDLVGKNKRTPLQQAAKKGRLDIIKLLLESKSPVSFDHLVSALSYLKPRQHKKQLIYSLDPIIWASVFKEKHIIAQLKAYKKSGIYRKAVYQQLCKMLKICTTSLAQGKAFLLFPPPANTLSVELNPSPSLCPIGIRK